MEQAHEIRVNSFTTKVNLPAQPVALKRYKKAISMCLLPGYQGMYCCAAVAAYRQALPGAVGELYGTYRGLIGDLQGIYW